MVLAPDEAVIKVMYERITGDSNLEDITGGSVRLYGDGDVPADPTFPYLVYDFRYDKIDKGRRDGDYLLDWFDDSGNSLTAWDIERALLVLLDEIQIDTDEAGLVTINNDFCNKVPEPSDSDVVHYASRWSIKFFAKDIVQEINSR